MSSSVSKNKHGGARRGQGRKPSQFISKAERLAFKDEAERTRYMKLTPRQRVVLALSAAKGNK